MLQKIVLALIIGVSCCQCGRLPSDTQTPANDFVMPPRTEASSTPILPLVTELDLSPQKVSLGRDLFHDTRLSNSERISCGTCHPVAGAGMIAATGNTGVGTSYYDIPTIFNTGGHFAYFWNGRAQSLEDVVHIQIQAENIMDSTWDAILERLALDPMYDENANQAYPGIGLNEETAVDALATYVRSLVTPNAAFDRWLDGESYSESAQAGYERFVNYGCVRCHQGAGIGGNMYASFRGYIETRDTPRTTDYGRFNVTNNEAHRYQFKVPSLRNVAVTAPYFHDGSVDSLNDAVELMARYQLGRNLERNEINQIVSFLESLTGWRDGALIGGAQ